MLISRHKMVQTGFTLIEVMVAVVILAILLSSAIPSFRSMIKNSQVRNAADSIVNGLQKARAEAESRNTNVAFTLGTGSSWTVAVVSPASAVGSSTTNDGSASDITVSVQPGNTTTVTFNNLGGVQTTNANGTLPLTQIDFAPPVGGTQNMRVMLGAGGSARMCDPGQSPGSNPRAC